MTTKEKKKEYDKAYRERNKEVIRKRVKDWYEKNKGKKQEYRDRHRERYKVLYKKRAVEKDV